MNAWKIEIYGVGVTDKFIVESEKNAYIVHRSQLIDCISHFELQPRQMTHEKPGQHFCLIAKIV